MKKGGLLLSENTVLLFDRMSDEEGMKFLRHIIQYHKTGEEPGEDAERLISISFDLFKADYDASQRKYQEKVDRITKINERKNTALNDVTRNRNEVVTKSTRNRNEVAPITLHNITSHSLKDKEIDGEQPSISQDYSNFKKWLFENCPRLLKMEIPTEEDYNKLMEDANNDKNALTNKLLAMNNSTDVPRKNVSIYWTCHEWLKRDKQAV